MRRSHPALEDRSAEPDRRQPFEGMAVPFNLIDKVADAHKVKPGTKRKLCPACERLGSTIGCMKCNAGPTNITW